MKNEIRKLETIEDVIKFLQTVQTENGLAQIKGLCFDCWTVNRIKNFSVEYFDSSDLGLPGVK